MLTEVMVAGVGGTTVGPIVQTFVRVVNARGAEFQVDSWLRVCHFVAQCALESDHFNTLTEYASGAAYEGRRDLGNTLPGDGVRFKGRGVIQITGRTNYQAVSKGLGVDVVAAPERLAEPELGVLAALWFWKTHGCAVPADADDIRAVTRIVNGGYRALADREAFLARAKRIIPQDGAPQPAPVPQPKPQPGPVPLPKAPWYVRFFAWLIGG